MHDLVVAFDRWYDTVVRAGSAHQRACSRAFGPEQYIGQNGFARRDDILALGAAVVSRDASRVLDICCGSGAPARLLANELGCSVVGVDSSLSAVQQLQRCADEQVTAAVGDALELPFQVACFDAALVLDSVASISSVRDLFHEVARVLRPGGAFGWTAETGDPLSAAEQAQFTRTTPPTVMERGALLQTARECGFSIVEVYDWSSHTALVAERLFQNISRDRELIAAELGVEPLEDLVATLGTLAEMLTSGRLGELAVVARRSGPTSTTRRADDAGTILAAPRAAPTRSTETTQCRAQPNALYF